MGALASPAISRSGRLSLPSGREQLEASLWEPASIRRASLVLPGGGSTLQDGVVRAIARVLERRHIAALRLNYRGVGRSTGRFYADHGAGEQEDARTAVDFLADRYPGLPLWVAGVSFGAWVGFRVAVGDRRISGLLGVAMPLRIEEFDLTFLRRNRRKPLAVVQGADDEYGPPREVRAFLASLPGPTRLFLVDGAAHHFPRRREAMAAAIAKAVTWLSG